MVLATEHKWGDKFRNGFEEFFAFLPNLIGFLLILIIGYFVAKVIAGVIRKLLHRGGLDRAATQGQGGRYVSKVTDSPSRLLGQFAFWALFLGVIALAVSVLGIDALTDFVGAIFAYIPNVIAALLIFLVAGAIATAVAALVARTMGDTPTGKIVASVAPVLIMAIAVFMILDQLKIAEDIVQITYMALMFGLALALALAFGLGGRDVAARMLAGAYEKGQESRTQVRRDVEKGKEQARQDLDRAKGAAQDRVESGGSQPRPSTGATAATRPGTAQTERMATSGAGRDTDVDRVERVPPEEVDAVPPGSADPLNRPRDTDR